MPVMISPKPLSLSGKEMIKIACPLCLGKNFKDQFIKDKMTVVQCQDCGLIFTNPRHKQKELIVHYDKNYYYCPQKDPLDNTRYLDYNARYLKGKEKKRFDFIFKKLGQFKPEKGKLLDIGAATGFFVSEAIRKGWDAQGVEVSKWAADWGKKNLKVKIETGEFEKVKLPQNAFDVVAMLDVLEHFQNPQETLKKAAKILKKDGIIYVETINFDNWLTRYLIGSKYVHMVPKFHLYYFGRKQLKQLLENAGFKILDLSLWSSSVGDYEHSGLDMYWQYLKLVLNPAKDHQNFALNDLVKIYARKQ